MAKRASCVRFGDVLCPRLATLLVRLTLLRSNKVESTNADFGAQLDTQPETEESVVFWDKS